MFHRHAIRDGITLDFETDRIEPRPAYPPEPVGLAVRWEDGETDYYAWGHPTGNNCDKAKVIEVLRYIWKSGAPLIFFNAKYDMSIAVEKLGMPMLPWHYIHDAMFLAFLANPHARELDLKSLAEDLLGWPPDEKDALADYVWENRLQLVRKYGHKITNAKTGQYSAGAWISKCPAKLVRPYAIGDVDRTFGLFEHLYPLIAENDMTDAYDRERRIMPIFYENERDGIHVDAPKLEERVPALQRSLQRADSILCDLLDSPDMNINSNVQLAEALSSCGVIDDDDWVLTKSGQRSVSKDNLTYEMFKDEDVARVFFYRNKLTTSLSTFLEPWNTQAQVCGGKISTNWNQVRGAKGGARTGRPSTYDPNLLNVPKEFDDTFDMPKGNQWGLEPLPFVREYILPDPGDLFLHRDFDGQEMRIFAHYESGPLLAAYQADPDLDPHEMVGKETARLQNRKYNKKKDRGDNKILNFQALYGGGAPAAAKKLNCTLAKAKEYKNFHDRALPGRVILNETIAEILAEGEPIRTWGGRCYFAEERRIVEGRMRDFQYKMINYLCQGSAADVTKESIIRWYDHPKRDARFLLSVYDETNISAHPKASKEQMAVLREAMEGIEMDLLMKSSGKIGKRWGHLEACD